MHVKNGGKVEVIVISQNKTTWYSSLKMPHADARYIAATARDKRKIFSTYSVFGANPSEEVYSKSLAFNA